MIDLDIEKRELAREENERKKMKKETLLVQQYLFPQVNAVGVVRLNNLGTCLKSTKQMKYNIKLAYLRSQESFKS